MLRETRLQRKGEDRGVAGHEDSSLRREAIMRLSHASRAVPSGQEGPPP